MDQQEKALVRVGDVIAGKYRVDRVLGIGGMGVVVAATHSELQQTRAIKFMLRETMSDHENVERFLREARAAARLQSQHAVKVHDVARLATGELYIVMEYLQGIDLKEHLKSRHVLPVPEAALYLTQACEAIAEAHAAGIVHRDLKPANLFLAERAGGPPCLKVLDFGIAKLSDGLTGADGQLTSSQVIIGSPLYMSPEQIMSTRNVDGRSDIWSLGVILYSMVTGQLPFHGATTNVIFAAVQRDPPVPPLQRNPTLPTELEHIILRCLEKDPALRFATATELAQALAPFTPSGARFPMPSAEVGETSAATLTWNRASSQQVARPAMTAVLHGQDPGSFQPATPFTPRPVSPSYPQTGSQNYLDSGAASRSQSGSQSFPHPGAHTNAPFVRTFETAPRARSRELLLAAGGFGAALAIVAVLMLVLRLSAHPSSSQAVPQPLLAETGQAPPELPSVAVQPAAPATVTPVDSASPGAEATAAPAVKPRAAPARALPRPTASAPPSKPLPPVSSPPPVGAPLKQRQ